MLRALKRVWRDGRAALSVEFVIGLPMIIVAQAIAFEAGRVMLDQHALESGVRDATRFLARANLAAAGTPACPSSGNTYYTVYMNLVISGLKSDISASDITCSITELYDGADGTLNRDYTVVQIKANITVETPLIGWWSDGITIGAMDQSRFIGE